MMNTAGMTTVCQISKVVATPSTLTCQGRKSQTFGTPSSLALCWKKWCLMSIHERWTILTNLLQRTLVQLTPSSTFPTQRYHALVHIQRTSYFWRAIVFGVLPPVSKLNLAQTLYHFISGYTALVAGTEDGIKEPTATFSVCFGAAFIMLHPTKYAAMLAEKMQKHSATGWLVNTGWSGGSYGSGKRIKLPYTRKIIDTIHSGSLLNAKYKKAEVFGLEIPTEVEGVPSEILDPVNTVMMGQECIQ